MPSEASVTGPKVDPVQVEQIRKESSNVPVAARFLDLPHMQARFARRDPVPANRWPALTWQKIRRGQVEAGMTKEMVAWSLGLAWERGTVPSLLAKDRWTYGPVSVSFSNGRVTSTDGLKHLP